MTTPISSPFSRMTRKPRRLASAWSFRYSGSDFLPDLPATVLGPASRGGADFGLRGVLGRSSVFGAELLLAEHLTSLTARAEGLRPCAMCNRLVFPASRRGAWSKTLRRRAALEPDTATKRAPQCTRTLIAREFPRQAAATGPRLSNDAFVAAFE